MKKPHIQTYSGELIELENPDPEKILLPDIARALSHLCRFTGHVSHFYSVAQHSATCCMEAQDRGYSLAVQVQALMHDAAEAYLGDVSSPLKSLLPGYKDLEKVWWDAICSRFSISPILSEYVHVLDREALLREAHSFLPGGPQGSAWPPGDRNPEPIGTTCSPETAQYMFLAQADRLRIV